jgi:hypothetical protein
MPATISKYDLYAIGHTLCVADCHCTMCKEDMHSTIFEAVVCPDCIAPPNDGSGRTKEQAVEDIKNQGYTWETLMKEYKDSPARFPEMPCVWKRRDKENRAKESTKN